MELSGAIVLDVGASTGGFTDCALKHDASKVYALDVGQNQLVNKLRQDSRVVVYEKVNFRNIEKNFFDNKFDLITMDVSFISAKLLTENVVKNLKQGGVFICLIKPQFEAGISAPRNSKGVITRKDIHYDVVMSFIKDCSNKQLYVNEVIYSPIKGGSGNVEFLAKITLNNKIIVSAEQVKNLIF